MNSRQQNRSANKRALLSRKMVQVVLAPILIGALFAFMFPVLRVRASETGRIAQVAPSHETASLVLEINYTKRGNVFEIEGKTTPRASVMLNGEDLPTVRADGSFSYFVAPTTASAVYPVTATAQDKNGLVASKHLEIPVK